MQIIRAKLPAAQVGAISEVAAATGSTFDEVLSQAVGFALGQARHVFGVCVGFGEVVCDECASPCCGRGAA